MGKHSTLIEILALSIRFVILIKKTTALIECVLLDGIQQNLTHYLALAVDLQYVIIQICIKRFFWGGEKDDLTGHVTCHQGSMYDKCLRTGNEK